MTAGSTVRIALAGAPADTPPATNCEGEDCNGQPHKRFVAPPNESCLRCGRSARGPPLLARSTALIWRTPQFVPYLAAPASSKRLLGGLGSTIEKVYHTRPQTVLGSDDQQPVVFNQAFEDG